MKKFPVYGSSGEEYLIKIKPTILEGIVKAVLYKKIKFLGITFNKQLRFNTYDVEKYEYDYIYMSKRQVQLYEESVLNETVSIKLKDAEMKRFNDWDGRV